MTVTTEKGQAEHTKRQSEGSSLRLKDRYGRLLQITEPGSLSRIFWAFADIGHGTRSAPIATFSLAVVANIADIGLGGSTLQKLPFVYASHKAIIG
jgi:hypothetical protein